MYTDEDIIKTYESVKKLILPQGEDHMDFHLRQVWWYPRAFFQVVLITPSKNIDKYQW